MNATVLDAIASPALFGRWFKQPETWTAWFVFLKVLFGLPLADVERAVFTQCTGQAEPPASVKEGWLVCGRRAGKSFILALVAVFLACFRDWAPYLSPGERGTIMVIATDRRQARVIFRYVRALLTQTPALAPLIERQDGETIQLTNGIAIEITTASFRGVRGYTIIACLLDEIAFWRSDESANPDSEILAALRPAMLTIPNALLLAASSPYAKRGVLYRAFRKHFGKPGRVLVWKADTLTMNPTASKEEIDEAYAEDPASAAAEYGAEFRSDIESYIAREVVDALIIPGRHELPPIGGARYVAFVDPSGGSSDSMTLAVGHRERWESRRGILDAVRERHPPFSPEQVVGEFAATLRSYGIREVEGDRYAGEWPRERFREHGISYSVAEKPKSDIYRDLLPILNSSQVELLDHPRLAAQLCGLERRTARGGRDSIDHPPGAHDDLANAAAGVIVRIAGAGDPLDVWRHL